MSKDDAIEALLQRRKGNRGPLYATPEEWDALNSSRKSEETTDLRQSGKDSHAVPSDTITITIMFKDGSDMTVTNPKFKDYKWQ